MANSHSNSPSPRLSLAHGFTHAFSHATPAHSAHNSQHSLRSSTSSRTPLHSLSLHDYRKLQNSPASQSATPPGKTLRRKAAAPALKALERVPSVKRTSEATPSLQSRPLHSSYSAHQLTGHQPLPPSPPLLSEDAPLLDSSFRSQSAGPRVLGKAAAADYPSLRTSTSSKVSNWKPIKKLPKPKPLPLPLPPNLTPGTSVPVFHTTPASSAENVSGTQSTPSSFSLSRFPNPPHPVDLSLYPPKDENAPLRLKTNFTAIAPATPPDTPAVIHYRGASFDLINPHDSLLFHDIETPSRDLDSSEYSPVRSSEEPLLQSEMAPRRALYTDLTSAYSSIRRREEIPNTPDSEEPSQPVPAYLSPESSTYSSPAQLYDSNLGVAPLAVKQKDQADSRFSITEMTPIKKLTQAITRKLGKSPEPTEQGQQEQELQELSPATPAEANFGGEYPRPLARSYSNIPSPTAQSHRKNASEAPVIDSPISETYDSLPALTSMVPDDPSSQMGRGEGHQSFDSTGDAGSKPYYEEVASLYPSSSVYTGEAGGGSPPSLYSRRQSRAFGALDLGEESMSNPFRRESMYSSTNPNSGSHRYSNRMAQEYPRRSYLSHNEKTDTISKFIDQYEVPEGTSTPENTSKDDEHTSRATKGPQGLSQFDFQLQPTSSVSPSESSLIQHIQAQPERARRPTVTQAPGSPPHRVAPLEPAFEYDEIPNIFNRLNDSEAFSPESSYGDTRNLLQLSQGDDEAAAASAIALCGSPPMPLEPSSSYSQSEHRTASRTISGTPQEALDQAAQIFEDASSSRSIPAIWSRRGSGNLFRNRQSTVIEGNEEDPADWETVGNKSATSALDDDSIADYSSTSEERRASRLSGGMYSGGASFPVSPPAHQRSRHVYYHPSALPVHEHPFSSSPPPLDSRASIRSTPQENRVTFGLSLPRTVATVPAFHTAARGHNDEPYFFMPDPAPWTREEPSPYALSDKETQELLNSGPNEEIVYEDAPGGADRRSRITEELAHEQSLSDLRQSQCSSEPGVLELSPLHENYNSVVLGRDNSFQKVTALGPKGNLTGTPLGTGMKEVGSSIADNSSPGAKWGSSVSSNRSTGPGFYTDPKATASKSVIRPFPESESKLNTRPYPQSPSQETLSPPHVRLNILPDVPELHSPVPKAKRLSKSPVSEGRSHRHGRSAVHGQTRLREMVLAPRTVSAHSRSTHFSDLMRGDCSVRASSTHTNAPLRPPATATSIHVPSASAASILTPHLRIPHREPTPEDEEQRRKLSWVIFGVFCLLPPLLMLYRWLGDSVVVWVSRGRFDSASVTPKRVALHAGAPLNILIVIAIIVPIIVLNA